MAGIVRQSEAFQYIDPTLAEKSQYLEDSREASEDYSDLILQIANRGAGLVTGTMKFD